MKTLVVAIALLGVTGWYHLREAQTPDGQAPLVGLNGGVSALKAAFNAERDRTRVIVSVAPSCPYCLKGASELQRELGQSDAAFYVIWQPILPTDWGKPRSWALARMSDPGVRQYWDPEHRVAAAIRKTGEAHEIYPQCCYEGEIWWDLMAVFPPGEAWSESLPKPLFIEGTVEDAIPQLKEVLQ